MKIKMLKTVEVKTETKDSSVSIKSGKSLRDSNIEVLMEGDEIEVTILKEKKGIADVEFSDGSTGQIKSNDFKKIKELDLAEKK